MSMRKYVVVRKIEKVVVVSGSRAGAAEIRAAGLWLVGLCSAFSSSSGFAGESADTALIDDVVT